MEKNFHSLFDEIRPLQGIYDSHVYTEFLSLLMSYSVGVTVAVEKHLSSSIYIFGFYDFLCFTLDLYIVGLFKCLMTSGSIESIDTTSSLFL